MRKQIGKRSVKPIPEKQKLKVVKFVEDNTQNNLALRRDHLYIEDVKAAMKINTLEQRILLRKHVLKMLNDQVPHERLRQVLLQSNEKDIHTLLKNFRIRL